MELAQLETLIVVAKTMNFTRASHELGLSQPAVSRQVKSLEEELGEILFERSNKGISLTDQGELVLTYAKDVMGEMQEMKRDIQRASESPSASLTVATDLLSVSGPFRAAREGFQKKYPNIEVFLELKPNHLALIDSLRKGDSDIGISVTREYREGLIAIPYAEVKLIPVIGKNHQMAKETANLRLDRLVNEKWFLMNRESTLRRVVDTAFKKKSFEPAQVYETNDPDLLKDSLLAGEGVGFLPGWSIEKDLSEGVLLPLGLGAEVKVPLYALVPRAGSNEAVPYYLDSILNMPLSGVELTKKKGV